MKWLLDTNVLSETVRPRPNKKVTEWIARQRPMLLAVSAVTIAELRHGAEATDNDARQQIVVRWLEAMVAPSFHDRTLPVSSDILFHWVRLAHQLQRRRITRSAPDLLIACTAQVHDLTLVTRNVRDFADTGVVVYDPWHDQTHRMDPP